MSGETAEDLALFIDDCFFIHWGREVYAHFKKMIKNASNMEALNEIEKTIENTDLITFDFPKTRDTSEDNFSFELDKSVLSFRLDTEWETWTYKSREDAGRTYQHCSPFLAGLREHIHSKKTLINARVLSSSSTTQKIEQKRLAPISRSKQTADEPFVANITPTIKATSSISTLAPASKIQKSPPRGLFESDETLERLEGQVEDFPFSRQTSSQLSRKLVFTPDSKSVEKPVGELSNAPSQLLQELLSTPEDEEILEPGSAIPAEQDKIKKNQQGEIGPRQENTLTSTSVSETKARKASAPLRQQPAEGLPKIQQVPTGSFNSGMFKDSYSNLSSNSARIPAPGVSQKPADPQEEATPKKKTVPKKAVAVVM